MQKLLVGVLCLAALYSVLGATVVKTKSPSSTTKPSKPVDDAVTTNRKKDARREKLAEEIALHQRTIDQFEKQNAFELEKKKQKGISRDQYEAAKAARDKAQQERDKLAR